MGMASNERLEVFSKVLARAEYFDEMKIPLCIVATDLISGESVHFTTAISLRPCAPPAPIPDFFFRSNIATAFLVDGFLTERSLHPRLAKWAPKS